MSTKIGRNEPCPCGSGKKYKHCHGRAAGSAAAAAPNDSFAGAVERVLTWLTQRHRKAMRAAFDELLLDELWPEDGPDPEDVDRDTLQMVFLNLQEWLLGEGDIEVAGELRSINDYVLGPRGPALSPIQRDYIRQLSSKPLKLYTVTEVRPDQGLTLVDAMDPDSDAFFVQERSGSRGARPGMLLGCRVIEAGDHLEFSGAIYPFSVLNETVARAAAGAALVADSRPDDRNYEVGHAIVREWLRQMLMPPRLPDMVDASTGQPLLFVTDHYRIVDGPGLNQALGSCPDVHADGDSEWTRASRDSDGTTRPLSSIRIGRTADRLEMFHRTQSMADEGRDWFEALAGASVRHLTREIADPAGALQDAMASGPQRASAPGVAEAPDLPPEVMTQVVEQALRRSYANWADEPIPALAGKTPRQAIRTAAGLERVMGLLRSYEANEADMAARQGRPTMSFQFLWDALGIPRAESR